MASVRVKLRPSTVCGKEGSVYYQVIHNRTVRQIRTDFRLFLSEWNARIERVNLSDADGRLLYLMSVRDQIQSDLTRLNKIIRSLDNELRYYTVSDIVNTFYQFTAEGSTFQFFEETIAHMQHLDRVRTAETYTATFHSVKRFRQNIDLPLDGITSELVKRYEIYLKQHGARKNTISFYMRIFRAVYNRAVERGYIDQKHPFTRVFTGIERTVKRAIPLHTVMRIKRCDLSDSPGMAYARDLFLFSFYTRGMSFVDIAYLRHQDLHHGRLTYTRQKTGQTLSIRWEKCMDEIVRRYAVEGSPYLFPIVTDTKNGRTQYLSALHRTNYHLKNLAERLQLKHSLTMYVARHSWASAARSRRIPTAIISASMGHTSEETTQIYLASLENSVIDKANKKLLDLLR